MKMNTSVTLEKEVVTAVEEAARKGENRSQAIERLLRQSLAVRERAAIDNRDRNIINAHADELNEEAVDVLGYQVETWGAASSTGSRGLPCAIRSAFACSS